MPPAKEYETSRHKIVGEGSADLTPDRSTSDIVRFFSGMVVVFEQTG